MRRHARQPDSTLIPPPSDLIPPFPMSQSPALFKEWSGYLKPEDISQLQTAYQFSETAHQGQFRKSGEPYISHPLAVANILAQWHMDSQALTAALLHDVMEDTAVTKTEISRNFGKAVAELVDGVSKLDKIEFESHAEAQAENFRKMLLAMARDVRVILIKLADRLHNMRTLDAVGPKQRRRVAKGTAAAPVELDVHELVRFTWCGQCPQGFGSAHHVSVT